MATMSSGRPAKDRAPSPLPHRLRVLVVEDEPDVATLIRYHLERAGHEVIVVSDGAQAVQLAHTAPPDLVLLDVMVPQVNGWEVCRRLRREADTATVPILMVTGRVEEGDKVLGFEVGADDYITKPFSPPELMARVRAVLRRVRQTTETARQLHVGDLVVDRDRFHARIGDRIVDVTRKEFELLAVLAAVPGRVFSRDELLDRVWGHEEYVEPRTVDVHLARLRAKFVAAKLPVPAVEAVRGVGYRLRDPDDRHG